jgi:hypothetical protein
MTFKLNKKMKDVLRGNLDNSQYTGDHLVIQLGDNKLLPAADSDQYDFPYIKAICERFARTEYESWIGNDNQEWFGQK